MHHGCPSNRYWATELTLLPQVARSTCGALSRRRIPVRRAPRRSARPSREAASGHDVRLQPLLVGTAVPPRRAASSSDSRRNESHHADRSDRRAEAPDSYELSAGQSRRRRRRTHQLDPIAVVPVCRPHATQPEYPSADDPGRSGRRPHLPLSERGQRRGGELGGFSGYSPLQMTLAMSVCSGMFCPAQPFDVPNRQPRRGSEPSVSPHFAEDQSTVLTDGMIARTSSDVTCRHRANPAQDRAARLANLPSTPTPARPITCQGSSVTSGEGCSHNLRAGRDPSHATFLPSRVLRLGFQPCVAYHPSS
jgi:hypothetical protein